MKIQSLGYILVETEDLSAWDHYGQEVCGFMKHPDFSDEEKLCLKLITSHLDLWCKMALKKNLSLQD